MVGHDLVKAVLTISPQVHLVARWHHSADADQVNEIAMPPRLCKHALPGVNQDNGEVGGRCTRHHVPRILLMTRRVSDNELALFGREEAISDVDGDSLLTLRGEAVDEKREVDRSEEHTSELTSLMRSS